MYGLDEHLDYEAGAQFGDPRRCHRHGTAISSPDGLHDGLCPQCEGEGEQEAQEATWEVEQRLDDLEVRAGWQVAGAPNVWGGR